MKRLLLFLIFSYALSAWASPFISVETRNISMILTVDENGRLNQSYLGKHLSHDSDLRYLLNKNEAYLTHGMEDYYEPAFYIKHNNGCLSTELKYINHFVNDVSNDVVETIINLEDVEYSTYVTIHYVSYFNLDIIKTYTEISHKEKNPVELRKFASSLLHLNAKEYYLTEFANNWAREVEMKDQKLEFGRKILESKLGTRANMLCAPFFQLSLNELSDENHGELLMGTLAWTGNFRFEFEVDHENKLRIISGINPSASEYELRPGDVFRTPDFIFTYSMNGKGQASRNFHNWARKFQLKDGTKSRLTLLNNWEATFFDFNEKKLMSLMEDASSLGVDLFLLDDGWFGNKYPRSSDHQGLGDWEETKTKLPHNISKLTEYAQKKNIKFGIWIEPEMVNPKSRLYEEHRNWVIRQPNRKEYYFRNQLVLDLSNPEVQDYVFGVVDNLLTKYPDIAFFKWDCNSPITNIHSSYLGTQQSHLYIEYTRGLYKVLDRVKAKYPNVPMMLCAGGGGRTDYYALKYFTEFWPSDNTNPVERLFIQWGYSQLFPAKAMCAHVTSWNKIASIKFRCDVAMMGKLGFDINFHELNDDEKLYCSKAVKEYKRLSNLVGNGDLYRLVSPYEGNHTSSMFVSENKDHAVVFAFDTYTRNDEVVQKVRLSGLDKDRMYRIKEISLMPKTKSTLDCDDILVSGEFLMNYGLNLFSSRSLTSHIIELNAE